jgi:hypothetical protein
VDESDEEAEEHVARSVGPSSVGGEDVAPTRAPRGLHRRGQAIDWSVRPEEAGTVDLVREEVDAKRKLRAEVAALAPYKAFARAVPEVVFPAGQGGEVADGAQAASGGDSAAECDALRDMIATEVTALREELAAALANREELLDQVRVLNCYTINCCVLSNPSISLLAVSPIFHNSIVE